jgi:hypothetical protein
MIFVDRKIIFSYIQVMRSYSGGISVGRLGDYI